MFLDGVLLWSLYRYEAKISSDKEALAKDDRAKEIDKKADRARKAANREQRKAQELQLKAQTNGQASFAPKQHIQQPDKNKKTR